MGKKCIPGIICIENMTLFLMFIIMILIIYFYYTLIIKPSNQSNDTKVIIVNPYSNTNPNNSINTSGLPMEPPPLRIADGHPPMIHGRPGIPINIETRGTAMEYGQIGILTKSQSDSPLILPLMGRHSQTGRDKWQYYTISNSGFVNTKLPVKVQGRSCTGEYGCDSLMNGDMVYVEGYDSTFRATIYDSANFQYIPYL